MDADNSMVIAKVGSEGRGEEGVREDNADGQRPDFRWGAHHTGYRCCVVELSTRNLYNVANQCHPNKFNTREKKTQFTFRSRDTQRLKGKRRKKDIS